jgi:hypothetical protein
MCLSLLLDFVDSENVMLLKSGRPECRCYSVSLSVEDKPRHHVIVSSFACYSSSTSTSPRELSNASSMLLCEFHDDFPKSLQASSTSPSSLANAGSGEGHQSYIYLSERSPVG